MRTTPVTASNAARPVYPKLGQRKRQVGEHLARRRVIGIKEAVEEDQPRRDTAIAVDRSRRHPHLRSRTHAIAGLRHVFISMFARDYDPAADGRTDLCAAA